MLLSVIPGGAEALEAVVAIATGDLCAEDACDAGEDCCPSACTHCACCAHPNAVPLAAVLIPGRLATVQAHMASYTTGRLATGYRAPPFRPPAT